MRNGIFESITEQAFSYIKYSDIFKVTTPTGGRESIIDEFEKKGGEVRWTRDGANSVTDSLENRSGGEGQRRGGGNEVEIFGAIMGKNSA